MKRKKLFLTLGIVAVLLITVCVITVVATNAEVTEPNLRIAGKSLSMQDSVYIYYAVPVESTGGADVKMLFWLEPQDEYLYGTQKYELSPEPDTMKIGTTDCYVFNFDKLAAKQMTVNVYARAYARVGEADYYSKLDKYSVLKYCHNMKGSDPDLDKLLSSMLAYGSAAQVYFDKATDHLADDTYYQIRVKNATLSDGSTHGLYVAGDKVIMTAPLTDADGATFSHWADSKGNKVNSNATYELTVGAADETYTPVYVRYSSGLEFFSNEDGTCCVDGMGDCEDTELIIPPVSPDGDKVVEISGSAFSGEAITSVSFPSTIEIIGSKAFYNCTSLTDVYYDGTEEEWTTKVTIGSRNTPLEDATKHFNEPAVETFTVTFVDHDGTVLKTETVESGKSATAPADPTREGYTFTGWDKAFDNVTEDMTVTAEYTYAATEPTILVESVSAGAGETNVEVKLVFLNNPGILGTKLTVSYDESVLTLKDAINGESLSSLTYTKPSRYKDDCNFMWFGSECGETADAVMLTLVFDISESAANGDYTIEVISSLNDTYDSNRNQLAIDVINGCIIVK